MTLRLVTLMMWYNYNYSNISLSHRIKTFLAYGLDFCLPVYKINFHKYFLPIESLIARMKFLNVDSCVDFSEFLNKLHSLSFKYYHSFNPFKVFSSIFSRQDILQLKEFAGQTCVVILDKDTYATKMVDLISDWTKFENISISIKKYTLKIEDNINFFFVN